MNIGIMSMQRVINYGSYLQAYGLKSVLESMGHQIQFVDYKTEPSLVQESTSPSGSKYLTKVANVVKMLSPRYRKWRKNQIRSNQSFDQFCTAFTTTYLPTLGVIKKRNERPQIGRAHV